MNRAPKRGNRCVRTNVFFTREEYATVKLAADDRGLSISEFLRRTALERAKIQETLRASDACAFCETESP